MGASDAGARAERARLLHESRRAATDRKAYEAIDGLVRAGEKVTFKAVAARAGLTTATLYNHPEVRGRIESLRDAAAAPAPQAKTEASDSAVISSLKRKMGRLEEENRALREENKRLREAASRSYGDYMESL